MNLALGTVQFGMRYGIANKAGQVGLAEIERILAYASDNGVDMLDTAVSYGDSEACLGVIGVDDFQVVTKLPAKIEGDVEGWVSANVKASLKRLSISRAYGLLLHRSQQLLGADGQLLAKALAKLKSDGLVAKIGVSIYDPRELELLNKECAVDLIQAPLNVFDRRLITSGWLQRLYDDGVEVHVRSVFLQGLLLMSRVRVPKKFSPWSDLFDRWHAWLAENHTNATEVCLQFANHPMVDRVVIGVDTFDQLKEILHASRGAFVQEIPNLSCNDAKLVNPSNWNTI
jgi:aryl-alcohol dehydrogenase-like predicted oxidoreductase